MDLKEHLTNVINDVSVSEKRENSESLNKSNSKYKHNYSSKMENFMNNTVINKYARTWSRLEPKLKVKKIEEYVENKSEEYNLDKSKKDELLSILVSRLRQNKLNKIGEITYDKEKYEIKEIKKLKFEENFFEFKD